ncbi:hypothetical protein OROHE_001992 [Orobanche hederae]
MIRHWRRPRKRTVGDHSTVYLAELNASTVKVKILKDSTVGEEGEKRLATWGGFLRVHRASASLTLVNIFGPEHRPIVDFALDNVQKLKLRAEKVKAQQLQGPPHDTRGDIRQNDH